MPDTQDNDNNDKKRKGIGNCQSRRKKVGRRKKRRGQGATAAPIPQPIQNAEKDERRRDPAAREATTRNYVEQYYWRKRQKN